MADKNWTDKLRQKMSEYTETPPGGLWEGIESAAGLGGKAAGGFWAWLTGRPAVWPVWALAGAAAAVTAVLLLRTPATPTVAPGPDPASSIIAQAEPQDEPLDVTTIEISRQARNDTPAVTNDTPAVTNETQPGAPAVSAATSIQVKTLDSDRKSAETRQEELPTSESDRNLAETCQEEPQKPESDKKTEEIRQQWTPAPSGTTRVPISRIRKSGKPLFAASLVGSNAPGGPSTTTSRAYGFSDPAINNAGGPSINPKMAMLSRNKSVQTNVSHRQDYQFGILFSYSFNDRWGIESGVQVTGLSSATTESTGTISVVKKENFTYLGVPLRAVYYPYRYKSLSIYTSAGPTAEYGLYSSWKSHDIMGDKELNPKAGSSRPGDWVFSASLNAGVQWQPWQYGAFFIQPGVVGRLTGDNSPESFYTTHPVSFQLSAGYKITF